MWLVRDLRRGYGIASEDLAGIAMSVLEQYNEDLQSHGEARIFALINHLVLHLHVSRCPNTDAAPGIGAGNIIRQHTSHSFHHHYLTTWLNPGATSIAAIQEPVPAASFPAGVKAM